MAKKTKTSTKKKGSGPVVDFSDVESGGSARVPEGDYVAKVKSVKQTTAESSGASMLKWEYEISEGKHEGKVIRDNTVLTPKALWRLKQALEAMGLDVPASKQKLDLKSYLGLEVGLTLVDGEPYNNRIKSEIAAFIDPDVARGEDVDEDEEDDDELEDEDDELEDDDDDDEDEDDEL